MKVSRRAIVSILSFLVNNYPCGLAAAGLKTERIMEKKFFVEVVYNDESSFSFDVIIEGSDSDVKANLMMITRGTLMASSASKATAYNYEGFTICSYMK